MSLWNVADTGYCLLMRKLIVSGATAFSSYGAFWISLGLYGVLSDTGIFTASGAAPKGLEAVSGLTALPLRGLLLSLVLLQSQRQRCFGSACRLAPCASGVRSAGQVTFSHQVISMSMLGYATQIMNVHGIRKCPDLLTCAGVQQVLAIWSIFTFLLFLCTLALNAALATLFFLLTITFALLAAGVTHATADKVAGVSYGSSPATLIIC